MRDPELVSVVVDTLDGFALLAFLAVAGGVATLSLWAAGVFDV